MDAETMLHQRRMPAWLQGSGVPITVEIDPVTLSTFRQILSVDGWSVEEGIERLVNHVVGLYENRQSR